MKKGDKVILLIIYILAFITESVTISAQTIGKKMSLNEILKYGMQENVDIKKQNLANIQSRYRVLETIGQGLPQINGSAQFTDNVKIQETLLPGEILGQPGTYIPVKFSQQYSIPISARLDQIIYNQTYFNGIKQAKVAQKLSKVQQDKIQQTVIYDVSVAYYQAIISGEQIKIMQANLDKLIQSVKVSQVQYDNKMARKIDLDQLTVNLANTQSDLDNAKVNFSQSLEYLKILVGYPLSDSLALATEILDEDMVLPANSINSNPIIQLYQGQYQLKKLEIKGLKTKYLPSLSGYAQYAYQWQSYDLKLSGADWLSSSAIGLSISVPIFDGLQKTRQIQQRNIELQSLEIDRKYMGTQLTFQYQNAVNKYLQNAKTVQNQKSNYELAKSVYDAVQVNYNNGMASLSDLINADSGIKSAQTLYLTALLQKKISALDILKANGELTTLIK